MFLKKIINGLGFLSLLFLLAGVVVPQRVFALADSDYGLTATQVSAQLPDNIQGETSLVGVIGLVVKLLLSFTGMFFLGMMLYAGIVWMKSMGASDDVERAKTIIQSAIIGLIIVSAAYAITNFVFTNLNTNANTAGNNKNGNSNTQVVVTEGKPCKIPDNTYGVNFDIAGQNGIGNCNGGDCICQPNCRYNNGVAKNGPLGGVCKAPTDNSCVPAASPGTCPNSGKCCKSS